MKQHDISLDHRKEFDEVFIHNAYVHVERMNDKGFWIGIEAEGFPRLTINTGSYRGEWFFNVEEEGQLKDGQTTKWFPVRRKPRKRKTAK